MDKRDTTLNDLNSTYSGVNSARQGSAQAVLERPGETVAPLRVTRDRDRGAALAAKVPVEGEDSTSDISEQQNSKPNNVMGHVNKAANDTIKIITDAGANLGSVTKEVFTGEKSDRVRDTVTSVMTPLLKVFKWATILAAVKGFFTGNPIESVGNAIKATLLHLAAGNSEKWKHAKTKEELNKALTDITLNILGVGVVEFGHQSYNNRGRAIRFAPGSVVSSTRGVLKSVLDPIQNSVKTILFGGHRPPRMDAFKLDPSIANKLEQQLPLDE